MDDLLAPARAVLTRREAYVVGGAVRDELLGRPIVDLDIACQEPDRVARTYAKLVVGSLFPLSERHGAWRVALEDGRTVDFTPLTTDVESDLATRDFTINAIARPLDGGDDIDPFEGRADLAAKILRAVSATVFDDDPLRLLRAVRLEDELGLRIEPRTERLVRERAALVTKPAGERILNELWRLTTRGWLRLAELGLLEHLDGSLERVDCSDAVDTPEYRLVVFLGDALGQLPISARLRRFAIVLLRREPPPDGSPRAMHRFRRNTEPWSFEALAFHGRLDLAGSLESARARDPGAPLVRGDELGLPPGPEVGRLLDLIEEERAAGTISTREEALELVRRHGTR
jgi:tRNA nucleotidyltransferase/poly(A) polymerase